MRDVAKVEFALAKTGSFFEESHCCNVKPIRFINISPVSNPSLLLQKKLGKNVR
jgi:hypothetical protein